MQKKRVLLTVLLLGTTVLAQGCMLAVVGAGAAGTVAYIRGDLEAVSFLSHRGQAEGVLGP